MTPFLNSFSIPITAHKKVLLSEGAHPLLGHHLCPILGEHRKRRAERKQGTRSRKERSCKSGEGQRIVYIYWYMGVSFHWRTPTLWVSFPRSPTLFSRTSAGQRWGRGEDKALNTSTKVGVQHRHTQFNIRSVIFK